MQQFQIEEAFIAQDEFLEAGFPMSCQQLYPSCGERLVVNVRRAVMRGESLNALADQRESFIERLPVEHKPCEPQVISMTEQRGRQHAAGERSEEFVVTQFSGGNDDRHAVKFIRWTSAIPGGLQLEKLRIAPFGLQQFLVGAQFRDMPIGDHRDAVGDAHGGEAV